MITELYFPSVAKGILYILATEPRIQEGILGETTHVSFPSGFDKFFISPFVLQDRGSQLPSLHTAHHHERTAKKQEAVGSALYGHIILPA